MSRLFDDLKRAARERLGQVRRRSTNDAPATGRSGNFSPTGAGLSDANKAAGPGSDSILLQALQRAAHEALQDFEATTQHRSPGHEAPASAASQTAGDTERRAIEAARARLESEQQATAHAAVRTIAERDAAKFAAQRIEAEQQADAAAQQRIVTETQALKAIRLREKAEQELLKAAQARLDAETKARSMAEARLEAARQAEAAALERNVLQIRTTEEAAARELAEDDARCVAATTARAQAALVKASYQARLREPAERSRLAASNRSGMIAVRLQATGKWPPRARTAAWSALTLVTGIALGAWVGVREPAAPAVTTRDMVNQATTVGAGELRLRLDDSIRSLSQHPVSAASKNSSSPGQ